MSGPSAIDSGVHGVEPGTATEWFRIIRACGDRTLTSPSDVRLSTSPVSAVASDGHHRPIPRLIPPSCQRSGKHREHVAKPGAGFQVAYLRRAMTSGDGRWLPRKPVLHRTGQATICALDVILCGIWREFCGVKWRGQVPYVKQELRLMGGVDPWGRGRQE
jgi:hypothetical protein